MGAVVPRLTEDPCSWDDLPSAVLLLARDGRASHANAAFCRLTGLGAEAARGAGWQQLLTDPDRAALLGALVQGEHLSLPLHLCSPGGHDGMRREVWVDCVAQWRPSRGRWVCVLHDVSATRQAERVASVQAEQLRLLADSVPALIACYDAREQRCLFANRPYALTFGQDEQSILGLPIAEVIGEAALQRIRPQLDTVLIEQRAVAYERQLVRADGRTQWVEVHLLPQLATDGRLIAFFVLISDISRHRLAEQAVRESEERLGKFMQASAEGIVFHKDGDRKSVV